jgi:hypothetical protein
MHLPRPLYYVLITTITELILVSGAILILLPTGFLKQLPLGVLGFFLIYKTIIATVVLIIMDRKRWQEQAVIVRGGGLLLGHVVGLLLGGILGGRYWGVLGAIVGVITLYLILGRIGAKISSAIGNQLNRAFFSPEEVESLSTVRLAVPTGLLLIIYGLVVPALFVSIALFLNNSSISISKYSEDLPTARTVVIALSLVSIVFPWLLRPRWMMKSTSNTMARENAIFILGMGFSVASVVYGFFLFLVFGASIVELSIFALASSLAAIIWGTNTKIKQQNAG